MRSVLFTGKVAIGRSRGFTLLEILVVMSIVLVMTSAIVFGFTGADRNIGIKTEAQRLALLIELVRSEATQTNEEWGVYITEFDYSFASFDPVLATWKISEKRAFRTRMLPDGIEVHVHDSGEAVDIDDPDIFDSIEDENAELPDIVVFSDGELTAFKLSLQVNENLAKWVVYSDGLERVKAEQIPND
ncbi:MAG: GspH/FimT family pseudopilin [Pseudomonadales bacterium]|nr:GspH/FimT family pseudopilin [Pseudomonadales bacterium]